MERSSAQQSVKHKFSKILNQSTEQLCVCLSVHVTLLAGTLQIIHRKLNKNKSGNQMADI